MAVTNSLLAAVALAALLGAAPTVSQQPTVSLNGVVRDSKLGVPSPRCFVGAFHFCAGSRHLAAWMRTDSDGRYAFELLRTSCDSVLIAVRDPFGGAASTVLRLSDPAFQPRVPDLLLPARKPFPNPCPH